MKTDGSNTAVAEKKTAPGNESTEKKLTPAMSMKTYLESKRASFEELFPTKKQADRFMRILIALPIFSPQILSCTHESILSAAILSARDGLEPDGRHAALVPFNNRKKGIREAVYIPMVHGYIRKAHDTGIFRTIAARSRYEKDEFWYRYNFDNDFNHVPAEGERGDLVGCYAFYVLKDGGRDFIYMSVAAGHAWAEAHASNAVNSPDSLYHSDYEAWLLKTVIRRVLHFAPIDSEIAIHDEDDDGMRNITPSAIPAPVFDITDAKEVEDSKSTPTEPQPEDKPKQAGKGEQPELITEGSQPGKD